jgi:hypothetical protein
MMRKFSVRRRGASRRLTGVRIRRLLTARRTYFAFAFASFIWLLILLATPLPERVSEVEHAVRGGEKRWHVILTATLLLAMSFFKVRRVRIGRRRPFAAAGLSVTTSALLSLFFCFAFGLLLTREADTETTLVYILGFAALIIGGQHLVEFESAENTIKDVNKKLRDSTSTLTERMEKFEENVETLNMAIHDSVVAVVRTFRYEFYRTLVTEAYGRATRRVFGIANHWPIDPSFWGSYGVFLSEDFWSKEQVYEQITASIQRERENPTSEGLRILFAGRLSVLPASNLGPELSPSHFMLFIGVLWRLSLAWRLREKLEKPSVNGLPTEQFRTRSYLRVMVADVPISAHVIDEEVFLLLHTPGDAGVAASRGIQIADRSASNVQPNDHKTDIASTYSEIIERYTRTHVRSAREYIASLFVLAGIAKSIHRRDFILMDSGKVNREIVTSLLSALGMDSWTQEYDGKAEVSGAPAELLTRRATELACDFVAHYYDLNRLSYLPNRAPYWESDVKAELLTVDRMIEDLY